MPEVWRKPSLAKGPGNDALRSLQPRGIDHGPDTLGQDTKRPRVLFQGDVVGEQPEDMW